MESCCTSLKGWRGGFDKGGFAAVRNHGVDPGNPADEAARTAAVIPGSAVLAIDSRSGEALGVVCKFDKHAAGVAGIKYPGLDDTTSTLLSDKLLYPLRSRVSKADYDTEGGCECIPIDLSFNADLMAMCTFLGADGQSSKVDVFRQCDHEMFRKAAKLDKIAEELEQRLEELSLRTRANINDDLQSYELVAESEKKSSVKKKTGNIHAISRRSLLPDGLPVHRCMLPVLHLILGLVNDVVQGIIRELLFLDGVEESAAEKAMQEVRELKELRAIQNEKIADVMEIFADAEDDEDRYLDFEKSVASHTIVHGATVIKEFAQHAPNPSPLPGKGPKHWKGIVKTAGCTPGGTVTQYVVEFSDGATETLPTAHWKPLLDNPEHYTVTYDANAIQERAAELVEQWRSEAAMLAAAPPANRAGVRSRRSRAMGNRDAEVNVLRQKADALEEASKAVDAAMAAIAEVTAEAEAEGMDFESLKSKFELVLQKFNICMQKYWSGTLVGPDCRRFLDEWENILTELEEIVKSEKGSLATDFKGRFGKVLKPLAIISRYTRAVRVLPLHERNLLKAACNDFAGEYGTCFKDKDIATPKAFLIMAEISRYVDMHHTLGIFSEEAMESLHPQDNKFRLRVRTIRDPIARHQALMKFHRIFQATKPRTHNKKKRKFKNLEARATRQAQKAKQRKCPGRVTH